jgi:hypothetical protein
MYGGISNLTATKTSDHALVITPNRIGSHPPYPSRDDGGHDAIRVHVHSVCPATPGDVTVGGAAPVHRSSSRARSRRGMPPAGPLEAYDWTRPEWWKDIPHKHHLQRSSSAYPAACSRPLTPYGTGWCREQTHGLWMVRNSIQHRCYILALLRSDPPDIGIPSKGHGSARKFACFANR